MQKTAPLIVLLATLFAFRLGSAATTTAPQPPAAETPASQITKTSTSPGWASRCVSDSRKGPLVCSAEESLVWTNTGQTIATVAVRTQNDTNQTSMLIRTPVGIYLPAGISIQIDDGRLQFVPLQTCDSQGCFAETEIAEHELAALKTGKQLSIMCENSSRHKIVLPFPLDSFAEAFQKIQ